MDRLAVTDHARKTALAEIDDESGATILLPLDVAHMDGLRRHSPEADKEGRTAQVCGKSLSSQ
jgi:hypothetical protein